MLWERDMLQEGALTNEGLFWLDDTANFLPVPSTMSHEEYAQEVMNTDMERLFKRGFIRIQAITQYLLMDLRRKASNRQSDALIAKFKDGRFGQIIVSRNPSDYQNFTNVISAIDYAQTGRLRESKKPEGEGGPFTEWLDRHGK